VIVNSEVETLRKGELCTVLLLYGAYNLCHNLAFLVGYHLLPVGAMKGAHPAYMIAARLAKSSGFWSEFGGTLVINVLVMGSICILLNLQRVGTIPLGHLVPLFLGLTTGLFLGTNSLAAMDLSGVPFLAGTATGLSIGGTEMLGYVCLIAATSGISIYQRQTWWRWDEKFVRTRQLREVSLSRGELGLLALGLLLIILAGYRES
jgi:hypothetical protein